MAYRFKPEESVQKGVRRILRQQIAFAERQLAADRPGAQAIHETRRAIKRIRALLRLARPGIGERTFRREDRAFRDIAARVAPARDRHVLLQTIAKIEAEGGADLVTTAAAMRKTLETRLASRHRSAGDADGTFEALRRLEKARGRLRRLDVAPDRFEALECGLSWTQRRGRDAMRRALDGGSDEHWHDWRKGVQRHWRQMQLLSWAWPAYFEVRIAAAKRVSQLLGDDHDLSVLVAFAADPKRSGLTSEQARLIADVCRQRQLGLRQEAAATGQQLYAESPKALGRHVAALWAAARKPRLSTSER
jgi:CHAD domain-containing protein